MRIRTIAPNIAIAGIFVVALLSGAIAMPHAALAKHKKIKNPASASADPCAEPTAFVRDHVAKIRALQASQSSHASSSISSLFGSNSRTDPETDAKISELRHDADGVNDLLQAGGCKPVDIDQEIKAPANPEAPAVHLAKKRH